VNKRYWVYMLASQHNGTLYIGASSELVTRVWQHKNKVIEGFTEQYDVDRLVWFEEQIGRSFDGDARAPAQEVESRVESSTDRKTQSRVERLVHEHPLNTGFPPARE
jgi:predicted GIY-YIG superfamily endonuclease